MRDRPTDKEIETKKRSERDTDRDRDRGMEEERGEGGVSVVEKLQGLCSVCVHQGFQTRMVSRVLGQNGISQACYIVKIYCSGPEPLIYLNYMLEIYHSGPEPSKSVCVCVSLCVFICVHLFA